MDTVNTDVSTTDTIILNQISASCDFIINNFEIDFVENDFFDFIKTHKLSLLSNYKKPDLFSVKDKISDLLVRSPYAYYAEKLKYCIFKSKIRKAMLIVDDIESSPYESQRSLVNAVLKLRDCLKNTGSSNLRYDISFLFTCRLSTYELLKKDDQINGFSISYPLNIDSPVPLRNLLTQRLDSVRRAISSGRLVPTSGAHDQKLDWDSAYSLLYSHIDNITKNFGEIIVQISNNNMRQALDSVLNAIQNSRWFEASGHFEGAFDVETEEYKTSSAGFLKALILQDSYIYSYSILSIFPNVIYNNEDRSSDLILPHIIKYMFQKAKSKNLNIIEERSLIDALCIPFSDKTVSENFGDVMEYSVRENLLVSEKVLKNGEQKTVYIPQTKLYACWKAMSKSSVFLECLRDVLFLEDGDGNKQYRRPTMSLPADQRFLSLLDVIEDVASTERQILLTVRRSGNIDHYFRLFGDDRVAERLFRGVKRSVNNYYFDRVRRKKRIPTSIQRRLSEVYGYLRAIYFR